MFPFVTILGKTIPTYSLWVLSGLSAGLLAAVLLAGKFHLRKDDTIYASLYAMMGIVAGGKIFYLLLNPVTVLTYLQHYGIASIMRGGFVFYGGLAGGLIGTVIYCKQYRIPIAPMIALMLTVTPLIHAFGRIGCLFAGCCYGIECNTAFAVIISERALFPVQLLEASANLLLFIVLLIFVRKQVGPGCQITTYLVGYASIRFICEFFRDDPERGIWGILSTSQIISIIIFLAVAFRFTGIRSGKRNRKQTLPDHAPSSSGRKPH